MVLFGSIVLDTLSAIAVLLIVAYWYCTLEFDYFKKRGISYVRPTPFVGNLGPVVAGRKGLNLVLADIYEDLKRHRFGGFFFSGSPTIMVCDPDMVKLVLTKDFSSVHDRGLPMNVETDPLSANLINFPGTKWKNLRSKLAPTFTTGKLKLMFPLIQECTQNLSEFLKEKAQSPNVEMKDVLIRYCTDVIGTCAFGVECNSFKNPNSKFYAMSRQVFQPSILATIGSIVFTNSRIFSKLFPLEKFFPGIRTFFVDLIKNTVSFRKKNNVERSDFVNLMMQIQKSDESKTPETHPDEVLFTHDIMAAQAFFFFIAGLDPVANTIGFALHHLSIDPKIQEDLSDEVTSVVNEHGGITYESLKEMKLLDRVVSEALRMYPAGGFVFREVTSPNYTLPGTDVTLKKGFKVYIPVQGIHYDPDIYPDPEKFDPDRFTQEAIKDRHPYAYIPFGEGPRVCIANRFAILECKLTIASLIRDFKFSVSPETMIPPPLNPRAFGSTPIKGFNLKVEVR